MDSQVEILKNFILTVKETERRLEEGQDDYALKFLKIRVDSDDLRELDEFKSVVGTRTENFRKNRYRDILPFDYSRVTIDVKPARTDSGDYINASFINGANGKVAYIASQGPLKETLADFWQMIYQYEVNVIVMLCDLVESGKPKCEKYWPDTGSKFKIGELRISLVSEVRERDHYVIRTLRMKRKGSSEKERMVFQFQYFGWPDHGTPDEIAPLLDFVNRLRDYQPEDQFSPLVVHCSAGCGRTGTVCALDFVRTLIKTKRVPADFNICDLVAELRKQRPAMVQSKEQYVLLHRAIACMFEQELAQTNPEALQVNVSELFISSPPLTPAPPVPAADQTSPKLNSLPPPKASMSPTLSSETSATSASDDGCIISHANSDGYQSPCLINGVPKAQVDVASSAVVRCGSAAEGGDNTSVTSYETVSTTKSGGLSAVEDDQEAANETQRLDASERHGPDGISESGQPDLKHAIVEYPVDVPRTISSRMAANPGSLSSHDTSKIGSTVRDSKVHDFPNRLDEHPVGPKPHPASWPDPEDVLNHIQHL